MKKILVILTLGLANMAYGQPNFDIADFNKKAELAEWLCEYDLIAWWTSDSVMAQDKEEINRLGGEWFCFEENNTWHAVYGKYQPNEFDLVFHFVVDSNRKISRTRSRVDTSLLHRYSRALQTANRQIAGLKDSIRIRFNQYIRENEDNTLSVWIFPAFQPDHVAIYGGEFIYTIDHSGTQVLKDDSYYQGKFRGFKVDTPKEIRLNYRETEKPTLGSVFFAWYYKSYFTKIVIANSKSVSSPFLNDKIWIWIHADMESKNK